MLNVPIQSVPNQSFTVNLNNNIFGITIQTCKGINAVSITINGVDTIDGIRAVAGSLIIPSQYQEAGNLMFLTSNYDLPIYTEFNISQSLIYFTAAELASFRTPITGIVTASNFNPLGALPLRFSPVGYH